MGFFKKIKEGLKKTRDAVVGQIDSMLKSFTKIDDELFEELEELLVMGDVGVPTAEKICKELRERVKKVRLKLLRFSKKLLPICSEAVKNLILQHLRQLFL